MAAITIKKSRLTIKSEAEAPAPVVGEESAAATPASPSGAVPVVATVSGKPENKVFAIIAMVSGSLAAVIMLTLLALQWLEWNEYHRPPSAFPLLAPAVVVPAAATAVAPDATETAPAAPAAAPESPAAKPSETSTNAA